MEDEGIGMGMGGAHSIEGIWQCSGPSGTALESLLGRNWGKSIESHKTKCLYFEKSKVK